MRSQVQVLASPPLFSQLRGLTCPTRSCSLTAWAAVGPHALRSRRAKDLPERATQGPGLPPRAHSWSPPPSSPGHGRPHAANPAPDGLCAAMPQLGVHSAHTCSQTDGRSCSTGGPWPAMRSNPVRCPSASTTTTRSSRRRRWPSTACAGAEASALARAVARAVRGYGRAARPWPWPCGCPPTRSTKSPVRTQRTRTGTRNARTPTLDTPDSGHPDTRTLDTGRADIARADTGHLTPDAWTLTEDADRATKPRQASGHLGRHDEPTACWTPNRVPVGGQRMRRSATMTARR
jgi:hypothetical protein